jgi:hypothetical protein
MKRYKVGDSYFWYNEGDQPSNAVLAEKKVEKKVESKKEAEVDTDVDVKIRVPKNKAKGAKAK